MSRLFVTYSASPGARFDRDYYVTRHLPLVEEHWGPAGLTSAQAYFPATPAATEIAIAVLTFADDASIDRALASPATPIVLGDLVNFTDIAPEMSRAIAP
ncbi:MAG TPA: EthD family reductase [Sphingomonas sp.]